MKTVAHNVLSIKVSRTNEKGPLAAEQMFANLHGILRKAQKGEECILNQEYFSFEIANVAQNIFFIIRMPAYLRDFFESQLYAQYPDVELVEIMDYIPFQEYQSIAGAELNFTKHDILPINTYAEYEDRLAGQSLDSLTSITEAIRKAAKTVNENVTLQLLFKPIHSKPWHIPIFDTLSRLKNGKNLFYMGDENRLYVEQKWLIRKLAPFWDWWVWYFDKRDGTLDAFTNNARAKKKDDKAPNPDAPTNQKMNINEIVNEALILKSSKLGYRVQIRVTYWSHTPLAKNILEQKVASVANAFKQFNTGFLNGFEFKVKYGMKSLALAKTRKFGKEKGMLINTAEAASLFHLPNLLVQTPGIVWVTSKKAQAPVNVPTFDNSDENELTMLGKTNFRGVFKEFGIKPDDRRRHMYVIGKTGMGKSTMLENMIFSDIVSGRGVGVVDPHGELADAVLDFVPEYRKEDVIVIDPSDVEFPVAINMLEDVGTSEGRSLISSGLISIFKKMFANSWGPRLEHVLRNTLLALLEAPNTNMMGIMRMMVDEDYRQHIISHVSDPVVLSFWNTEFANFNPRNLAEIVSPIQNKVGQFLSSPIVRNIVGQNETKINIRDAMDSKKILIVNLSKGKIGEDNSSLLGSMVVTKIQLDAMSRANIPNKERVDFYLYVDEFQNFATDSFATILSEARKYKLNLTMANQYIAQMEDTVRDAVFGNVGSIVCFQTGYEDSVFFESQLGEVVSADDIMALEKYTIYIRLLINGMPSPAFSAATLPPPDIRIEPHHRQNMINLSRMKYSEDRKKVEDMILKWSAEQDAEVNGGAGNSKGGGGKKKAAPQVDLSTLTVGTKVKANIIGITDYGLFLSYQGIEGLLHVTKIPDDEKKILKTSEKGGLIEVFILEKKGDKLAYSLIDPEAVKKMEAEKVVNPLQAVE